MAPKTSNSLRKVLSLIGLKSYTSRVMMTSKVTVRDELTKVSLEGEINEHSDFSNVLEEVVGDVEVDLDGIARANSSGLLRWLEFVHSINDQGGIITLRRCRTHFVDQLNMVYQLAGNLGRVASFYAPYVCDECDHESEILLRSGEIRRGRAPSRNCPNCANVMEFEGPTDSYFQFLSSDTKGYVELNLPCQISTTDGNAPASLLHFTASGAIATAPEGMCRRGLTVILDLDDKDQEPASLRAVVGYVSTAAKGISRVELTWDLASESSLQRFKKLVQSSDKSSSKSPTMSVLARSMTHRESILNELAKGELQVQCTEVLPLDAETTVAVITEDGSEMPPMVEEINATTVSVSRSKDGRVFVGLRQIT